MAIPIIDSDTHVTEPADLWTSRVASKWGDRIPHVKWDGESQTEAWFIGDENLGPAAASASYGWKDNWPSVPPTLADAHPAAYDAAERLKVMDASGIYAEVLYPNVGGFGSTVFLKSKDPELVLECVRAYNDFLIDWIQPAPERFVPVAALPFWDVQASVKEIERAASIGHRAVLFSGAPHEHGMPYLADRHWDPIWAAAQAAGLSVSLHVGSGDLTDLFRPERTEIEGSAVTYARGGASVIQDAARHLVDLLLSGILPRFPELIFVSVESGIGWIPFMLETCDYHFLRGDVRAQRPEFELLPSDYFRRQVYGCYWFESIAPRLLLDEIGVDRIMFETDFPHPTCLGPELVADVVENALGGQSEQVKRAILWDNAAALYGIEAPRG